MTPLAGAVYSKNDLEEMFEELNAKLNINLTMPILIKRVLQSCQNGGHYLPYSDGSCAVASAVCATQNIKDAALRRSIINKTYKQYTAHGKVFEMEAFEIYTKYATGGVPVEFSAENLIKISDDVKKLAISAKKQALLTVARQKEQVQAEAAGSSRPKVESATQLQVLLQKLVSGTEQTRQAAITPQKGSSTVTPFVAVGQSLSGTYIHM
ncbi:hypothetical protein EVAR_70216_1 [Eumeta japonica]|uniref:Uncharacterized protein n=1 Tax=Eumeta variegata TaxID=151549 RepID=A0A4C1T8T7_EUMVA|nr:hypothetical protein EVAR_70216_1 [Eumeta japonica]